MGTNFQSTQDYVASRELMDSVKQLPPDVVQALITLAHYFPGNLPE